MTRGKTYYVYLLANRSRNLYTGVTNSLKHRVLEHKQGLMPGFTRKYRVHRLVHFEPFGDVREAIRREKQIKAWRREKKLALISRHNPGWIDLAADWYKRKPGHADPSPRTGARARDDSGTRSSAGGARTSTLKG